MPEYVRKSGTNLKLSLTGETYDDMYSGTAQALVASQVSLLNDTTVLSNRIPCWQVIVQADPDNAANIVVGESLHGCHIVLRAGESISIPVNEVGKIQVRAVAGTQTVNWLAII